MLYDDFAVFLAEPYNEALKRIRSALGMPQKAFAEHIGLFQAIITNSNQASVGRPGRSI